MDYKLLGIEEPRLMPGYAGHVPGLGPKGVFQMGESYGKITHRLLTENPTNEDKFGPIFDTSSKTMTEEQNRLFLKKHETTAKDLKLRETLVTGYAGFVPQKRFLIGKNFTKESEDAIAQFEKIRTIEKSGKLGYLQVKEKDERQEEECDGEGARRGSQPVASSEDPLNVCSCDAENRYKVDDLVSGLKHHRLMHEDQDLYSDFDKWALEDYKKKISGDFFSSSEEYQRKTKEAMCSNRMSSYDYYGKEPLKNDVLVPWYMQKGHYPEFGKPKTIVAESSDVLFGERRFRDGLRGRY